MVQQRNASVLLHPHRSLHLHIIKVDGDSQPRTGMHEPLDKQLNLVTSLLDSQVIVGSFGYYHVHMYFFKILDFSTLRYLHILCDILYHY